MRENYTGTEWHWTPSSEHPTTQFDPSFSRGADLLISVILIFCFLVGTLLNLVAALYFGMMNLADFKGRRKHTRRYSKKLLYNGLYFLNTVNDVLICCTVLPVAWAFIQDREPMWFDNTVFCMLWGALWEVLPYTSIMYVAALSLTRTYHLVFPLNHISVKLVAGLLGVYLLSCVGRTLVPVFSNYGTFIFQRDSVYCFEWARQRYASYVKFAEYSDILQLSLPMVPILCSCLISTAIIYTNKKSRGTSISSTTFQMQQQASNTIILITILYIVFNIPVIGLCVLYTISFVNHHKYHEVFNTRFLYWYSWNICYILGIALNSTLNPALYVWRMKRFREFIVTVLRERSAKHNYDQVKKFVRANTVSSISSISMLYNRVPSTFRRSSCKTSDTPLPDIRETEPDLADLPEVVAPSPGIGAELEVGSTSSTYYLTPELDKQEQTRTI